VVGFRKKAIASATLPQLLRDAGYTTALVGREMHQAVGPRALGYQVAIRGSTYVANDDYANKLKQVVPEADNIRRWVTDMGLTYNLWQAKPWPIAEKWHPTAWTVAKSRKVLAEAPAGKPLFLTTSFYAPHPPLFPPKKHFDACLARRLPDPAHGDWVDWDALTVKGAHGGHRVLLKGRTLRHAQAGYFGLIDQLDAEIAPLIAEFKARSRKARRPWLIVFTTDHGEMLGDHGYFRKCEPFEGSANIPLVIAGSEELGLVAGVRCNQPVGLEDLLPTLAQLAGAPCGQVDGASLVDVLRGRRQLVRQWLHFEHSPCYSKLQAFHALTDGRHKYIWRPTDGREHLFDLDEDPLEEHDLAAEASSRALLEQWRGRLVRRLAPRPEGFSDGKRLIPGRPYRAIQPGVGPKTAEAAGDNG
jgi:arylsulfatase A-like enzyme